MSNGEPRRCAITITIDDVEDRTQAVARMAWRDRTLVGIGRTRPTELFPDQMSERLAVSRALSDLIERLQPYSEHDPGHRL